MKKENFKVRNIHDRDGHTEQAVLEEKEILEEIEKWLEKNSIIETLKKESIFRHSQTFGIEIGIEIDTRNGEIKTFTHYPNQYNDSDSFFIELISIQRYEFSEHTMCEGNDMEATVSEQFIIDHINYINNVEDIEHLTYEKTEDGKYRITWWNNYDIDCEDFIRNWLKENYKEWVENYKDWLLEDITTDYSKVTEYYQNLRDVRQEVEI